MKSAYRVSTEQHGNMKSGVLSSKNSTSCKLGVIVHCLAQTCKDQLSPQTRKFDRFARFCGCNRKTSNIWHQEPDFSLLKQGSNWQHQLGLACLYPWHITTSKKYLINCHVLLKHKTFRISIYSATTGKNFMQIAHHLSELWKKQKGSFYETPYYLLLLLLLLLSLSLHCNVCVDNPWSLDGYKMRFDSAQWFPQYSAGPKPVKSKSYLLMCETRDASKPLPVIRWYRNGRAVRNNRHFYIIVSPPPSLSSTRCLLQTMEQSPKCCLSLNSYREMQE